MKTLITRAATLTCALLLGTSASAQQNAPTLVIDDTEFWGKIPVKDQITDAAEQEVPFLFNNSALKLLSMANIDHQVTVPEAGEYYVYARSKAASRGQSFRVALGTKIVTESFMGGGEGFTWQKKGPFELAKGPLQVRLTRIVTAPTLDALFISKNADLKEDVIKSLQGRPEAKLIKEYKVPPPVSVNWGDANNDGKLDMLITGFGYNSTVIDHDGKELWTYKAPEANFAARSTDDINGLIWDLDGDGKSEVIHWRMIDNVESIAVVDATTGEVKRHIPWPHVSANPNARRSYNNHRMSIARFGPTPKESSLVVYSDPGGGSRIDVFDKDLKPVWNHVTTKAKDHLGHNCYIVDLNKDGVDEVLVSAMLIDAKGKVVWNRYDLFNDNHDHADQSYVTDLNNDGKPEIVAGWSDVGAVALDAMTGELLWWNQAEHTQRIRAGNFLDNAPTNPQVVAGQRIYGNRQFEPYLYGQVKWFDAKGNHLMSWPDFPLNCNPVFTKGDYDGDGGDDLFYFKFRLNRQGKGEFYFPDEIYTMFDFQGDKGEEVITMERDTIRIYGSPKANSSDPKFGRDVEYLRTKVVNIEH